MNLIRYIINVLVISQIYNYRAFVQKRLIKKKFPLAIIDSKATITKDVILGDHVKIGGNVLIRGNIHIGKGSFINGPSHISCSQSNSIVIGAFCSIADFVYIINGSHNLNTLSTYHSATGFYSNSFDIENKNKSIIIGNDVWIGAHSVILEGVIIGDGAVIAAGSVVTKDVETYSIVGGVPAKLIRKRFDEQIIEKLQQLKWWEKDDEAILKMKKIFQQNINELNMQELDLLIQKIASH
jgi:virginiamycin A acetyltransferase